MCVGGVGGLTGRGREGYSFVADETALDFNSYELVVLV